MLTRCQRASTQRIKATFDVRRSTFVAAAGRGGVEV
jgi:hypothetical protein